MTNNEFTVKTENFSKSNPIIETSSKQTQTIKQGTVLPERQKETKKLTR